MYFKMGTGWAQDGHKLRQMIVLNGFYKNKLSTLDSGSWHCWNINPKTSKAPLSQTQGWWVLENGFSIGTWGW